jgi:hypothetical protein
LDDFDVYNNGIVISMCGDTPTTGASWLDKVESFLHDISEQRIRRI